MDIQHGSDGNEGVIDGDKELGVLRAEQQEVNNTPDNNKKNPRFGSY